MSLIYPVKNVFISQKFGENPETYKKLGKDLKLAWPLNGHNGLDFRASRGTAIYAPHSGKVVKKSNDPNGYGVYLRIENDKIGSVLGHLLNTTVSQRQIVKKGQLIGHADNTGFSTGSHLHFGYYPVPRDLGNGYLGYIDQLPLLEKQDSNGIITPGMNEDTQRALKLLEDFKNKEGLGNMEGTVNAVLGAFKDLETLKLDHTKLVETSKEKSSIISGQKVAIKEAQEQQDKLAELLSVENDFVIIKGDVERLIGVETNFDNFKQDKEKEIELKEEELRLARARITDLETALSEFKNDVSDIKKIAEEGGDKNMAIKKVDYPSWKKVIWRYARIAVAAFGVSFPFGLLVEGDGNAVNAAVKAALIAGVAAIFKAVREGVDYRSPIHKLPL
jgi:hypothetical protein